MSSTPWSVDYATIADDSKNKVAEPLGFEGSAVMSKHGMKSSRSVRTVQDDANDVAVRIKCAWDIAMAPAKNIPMNAIMIYMSGNSVQIFSVMITAMLFFQPAKAVMATPQVFERLESKGAARSQPGADLLLPKLTYIGLHVLTMLLGVYKINSMGLLPTTTSDWLTFLKPKEVIEYTAL